MVLSKQERLEIFFQRLASTRASASEEEAYETFATVLNAVEDELSEVPFDPASWRTDGRLYPPQMDNRHVVIGHPLVSRYRSLKHNTFIGANGAIEVQTLHGEVIFEKPGADGKYVWQI